MKLTSNVFAHEGEIPSKYTCDGENVNPPLMFTDVPKNAKSLVLIMDDPDVPKYIRPEQMFDHWVVFNMPHSLTHIDENSKPQGMHGITTNNLLSYYGPCPPDREHRYFFKLYALDALLSLSEGATKKEVEKAMEGHIIAKTELMGRYERVKK